MNDVVIRAEGLGKKYRIGHQAKGERYTALRDVVTQFGKRFARSVRDMARGRELIQGDEIEEFWALKDVNFEINRGDVVGIIGRNGAGKSTLLKVLSRITEPSAGRVEITGRIASLLEVGTGFHPELTGRENIFLNGAILGMSRVEIRRKFDEIVAFAEVEKFLDTPVKRYSSGMYVRLAFSVAAHLEPEILVIDEVLAVGDAEFQKKCLGKMGEVAGQGRTVLFVSHQIAAISALSTTALYLAGGQVLGRGPTAAVVQSYLRGAARGSTEYQNTARNSATPGPPFLVQAQILTSTLGDQHESGEPLKVNLIVTVPEPIPSLYLSIQIVDSFSRAVIHAFLYPPEWVSAKILGRHFLTCSFPKLRLNVGQYTLTSHLSGAPGAEAYESLHSMVSFEVIRSDVHVPWGWRPEVCTYFESYSWEFGTTEQSDLNVE